MDEKNIQINYHWVSDKNNNQLNGIKDENDFQMILFLMGNRIMN